MHDFCYQYCCCLFNHSFITVSNFNYKKSIVDLILAYLCSNYLHNILTVRFNIKSCRLYHSCFRRRSDISISHFYLASTIWCSYPRRQLHFQVGWKSGIFCNYSWSTNSSLTGNSSNYSRFMSIYCYNFFIF